MFCECNVRKKKLVKMEILWNQVDLACPPNAQWRTESQKFDVSTFMSSIDKIIKELRSQGTLHIEAAALSRLIYRMKSKFRNDKGLKNMCKVNRALLKYLSLSLDKEYEKLQSYVEVDGKYVTLPSRQMIEYVLVRTQGFAKLMLRIEETARLSAHFLKTRINLGHAWCVAIVAYSLISRIWVLSRQLVKKCCTWYSSMYQFLKVFESVGLQYLPKGQELPLDLKSWLTVQWISEPIPSIPDEEKLKGALFKLIERRATDSDDEIVSEFNIEDKLEETKSAVVATKNKDLDLSLVVDAGEVISREEFRSIDAVKLTENDVAIAESDDSVEETNSGKPLSLDCVKTKLELEQVLNQDSYPGLDKLRWNITRKKSKKLLGRIEGKKESVIVKKVIRRIKSWID